MIPLKYRIDGGAVQTKTLPGDKFAFGIIQDFLFRDFQGLVWQSVSVMGRPMFKVPACIFANLLCRAGIAVNLEQPSESNLSGVQAYVADISGNEGLLHVIVWQLLPDGDYDLFFVSYTPSDMQFVMQDRRSRATAYNLQCIFEDSALGLRYEVNFDDALWKPLMLTPHFFEGVLTFDKLFEISETNPLTALLRDKNGPNRACAIQLRDELVRLKSVWMEDLLRLI